MEHRGLSPTQTSYIGLTVRLTYTLVAFNACIWAYAITLWSI